MAIQTQFEIDGNWTSVDSGDLFVQQIANETDATLSTIGQSVLGKEIYALTVGTGSRKILMTSGVHGTEPGSRESFLMKARDVCYNEDGLYTNFLLNHSVMMIPTMNPDRMHSRYRNEDNIDINRIVYYLDSPEGLAFLETVRDFKPEAFFDFHEHSGTTDKDVLFVFAMDLDPNTDPSVRSTVENTIKYIRGILDSEGITTDYYFKSGVGFGSLTSGTGILGIPSFTTETYTRAEPAVRIAAQHKAFNLALKWFSENHDLIDTTSAYFKDNMLGHGDKYTLMQGMSPGAEMYLQATHEVISCPESYKVENLSEFQEFIDVYGIEVNENNIVPVNQPAGRMIPHLLDPISDMKVATASRIESTEPEIRTDGRYTKVLYDEWREVFIQYM